MFLSLLRQLPHAVMSLADLFTDVRNIVTDFASGPMARSRQFTNSQSQQGRRAVNTTAKQYQANPSPLLAGAMSSS